ncbi:MAG TPA: hypothetical protein VF254_00405 [Gammaproteobacteria bacterium]
MMKAAVLLSLAWVPAEPMLDGDCDEHVELAESVYEINEKVTLYITEREDHVWFCYTVPEGRMGVLDLTVDSPGLEQALNLHVSAQLGEWPANDPGAAPAGPEDPRWWNVAGWHANTLRFRGMRETEQGRYPVFRSAHAREMQLAMGRFGTGVWKLVFAIDSHSRRAIRWPAEGVLEIAVGD